jgi:prepilin-type N-terminal cleavage/methylation domain-containing protein
MSRNSRGYSLIEMIVVVGMIGILAAIGSASYQSYVIRARTAEAKVSLAAIYTAEKQFFLNNFSFTLCLQQLGYQPYSTNSYYYTGFMNSAGTTCGPTKTFNCVAYDFSGTAPAGTAPNCSCGTVVTDPSGIQHSDCFYLPRVDIDTATPLNGGYVWFALANTFTAGAQGKIKTGKLDVWTIDEQKRLARVVVGE